MSLPMPPFTLPKGVLASPPGPMLLTNTGPTPPTWAEVLRHSEDRHNLVLVALASRPGAKLFLVDLEHEHFAPGTDRNALFQLVFAGWEGLPWLIAWLPLAERELAVRTADRCGMVLREGAVPRMITDGARPGTKRVSVFPCRTRNVRTVENRPDSVIYQPGGAVDLRGEENIRVQQIIDQSNQRRGRT